MRRLGRLVGDTSADEKIIIYYFHCMRHVTTTGMLLWVLGFPLLSKAQLAHQWSYAQSSSGTDEISNIYTDAAGNVTAVGSFANTVAIGGADGSEELNAVGGKDAMLIHYSDTGEVLLAIGFGGSMDDQANDVVRDTLGNFYVTGAYQGTMDIDPGPDEFIMEAAGLTDIFLAKFSAAGELIWAQTFGDDFSDGGRNIALDTEGNIYVSGAFRGTLSFLIDGDITDFESTSFTTDVFLAKFDSDGNTLWAAAFGGGGTDNVNGMEVRGEQIFLTGEFTSTIDLDASAASDMHTSAGFTDIFLTAYSTEGDFIWGHAFGSNSSEFSHDLAVGPEGQVYITGNFWNTVNFNTTGGATEVTSNAQSDIFLAAFATTGDNLWAISAGGTDAEEGLAVGAGNTGPIITGTFGSTVDFDPGPDALELSSAGFYEVYMARYTSDGAFIEAGSLPSVYSCYGQAITVADNDEIFTGGRFSLSIDMDPGIPATALDGGGGFSGYVAKYTTCSSYLFADSASICAGETYAFQGSVLDATGFYEVNYSTAAGCDSTFTLVLDVQFIDTSVIVEDMELTAVFNEAYTYQWLDCLDGGSPVADATSNVFDAPGSGSYALQITFGSCSAITECFDVEATPTGLANLSSMLQCLPVGQNNWQFNADHSATIQVMDTYGRLHETIAVNPGSTHWSGDFLSPGVYILAGNWLGERWVKCITVL